MTPYSTLYQLLAQDPPTRPSPLWALLRLLFETLALAIFVLAIILGVIAFEGV
jgi:hypothetical protein